MFGNNQTLYNEVAWLSSQLLANYSTNPTTAQQVTETEISFAIWQLTYGVNNTGAGSPLAYLASVLGGTNNAEYQAVLALLQQAASEGSYDAKGWEILTSNGTAPTCGSGSQCPSAPPQEFLVQVPDPAPESSAWILFGADMLGLLVLGIVFRRRLACFGQSFRTCA